MRSISVIFFLLLSTHLLFAVKAYPYPIKVKQPDGSTVEIIMHGDEFFHFATTADGKLVARTADGCYRYAVYENGKITPSGAIARSSVFLSQYANKSGIDATEISRQRSAGIRKLEASGGMRTIDRSAAGTINILVIPVEFSDVTFTCEDATNHFYMMLNQPGYSGYGAAGSAKDYFEANIKGTVFNFDVIAPVRLPETRAYYGANDQSTPSVITYDKNIKEMVKEACTSVNSSVDFSKYDNDKDGNVDYVFIYFAGHNEAESGNSDAIWPQTYSIYNEGIKLDGVRLSMFGCTSELMGGEVSDELGGNRIYSGIGNFCHEFSHALGLQDLYDVNNESGGNSKCLWGRLSVMDEGNYNNNGRTPPYYCAIDRELAGILEYEPVDTAGNMTLYPIGTSNKAVMFPCENTGEYFLMEYRNQEGWDAHINGNGLIVYHLDKSSNIVDGITASVRWSNNLINTYAGHECADLVEAYSHAEHISQVFFPGQACVTEFSPSTDPAFTDWDGIPVGYRISDISQNGSYSSFSVREDLSEFLLKPENMSVNAYQRSAFLEWECDRTGIFKWGIEWESKKDTALLTSYTIDDLEPGTAYTCIVYHIGNYSNGDTVSVDFSTPDITSSYPKMAIPAKILYAGDHIDLVIENISEEVSSVRWFINETEVYIRRAVFNYSGEFELKAIIQYASDKSEETISRKIMVHEKEE